jgi:hypothetical protein
MNAFKNSPRSMRLVLAMGLAVPLSLALAACSGERREDEEAPFVLPEASEGAVAEAPFRGPVGRIDRPPGEEQPLSDPHPSAPPPPGEPPALPAPPVAEIAAPDPAVGPAVGGEAEQRRAIWLGESFRCKAISTTRLRRCRFEATADGYRLEFPVADVTCENVIFDERGDPEKLTGCRGAWLRVPATNGLRPNREREVWSGSHSGWRWKGDRQPYCCPGLWLEVPDSLKHRP